jgi:hypothetical protein
MAYGMVVTKGRGLRSSIGVSTRTEIVLLEQNAAAAMSGGEAAQN